MKRSAPSVSNARAATLEIGSEGFPEYFQAVEQAGRANLASGAIYDAILGHCALKARAETLYTWNTDDFLRLSQTIASRVKRPDQTA